MFFFFGLSEQLFVIPLKMWAITIKKSQTFFGNTSFITIFFVRSSIKILSNVRLFS